MAAVENIAVVRQSEKNDIVPAKGIVVHGDSFNSTVISEPATNSLEHVSMDRNE